MEDEQIIASLVAIPDKRLSDWEKEFVGSVKQRKYLSENQRERARAIVASKSSQKDDKVAAKEAQWEDSEGCVRCLDGMVAMRFPFGEGDRSSRFDYSKVPEEMQFREAAFPCTCNKGELRKEWGGYDRNAMDAWKDGWRTPDRMEEVI